MILYTLRVRELTEVPIRCHRNALDRHNQPDRGYDEIESNSSIHKVRERLADWENAPIEQCNGQLNKAKGRLREHSRKPDCSDTIDYLRPFEGNNVASHAIRCRQRAWNCCSNRENLWHGLSMIDIYVRYCRENLPMRPTLSSHRSPSSDLFSFWLWSARSLLL